MPAATKTLQLIESLEASKQYLVDDKIVLTDEQIALEIERRQSLDLQLASDRQVELNDMFPDRMKGNLYAQLETTETFDF